MKHYPKLSIEFKCLFSQFWGKYTHMKYFDTAKLFHLIFHRNKLQNKVKSCLLRT